MRADVLSLDDSNADMFGYLRVLPENIGTDCRVDETANGPLFQWIEEVGPSDYWPVYSPTLVLPVPLQPVAP